MEQQKNDMWAIVELMGHGLTAGIIRKSDLGGLLRVDVPINDGFRTEYYGEQAIYSIKVVSEEIARAYAVEEREINNIISTNGKVAETAETVECDNCHNYHSEYTVYSKWIIDKKVCRNFCDDCLTSVFIDTLVENGFNYEKIVLRQPLIAELEKEQ